MTELFRVSATGLCCAIRHRFEPYLTLSTHVKMPMEMGRIVKKSSPLFYKIKHKNKKYNYSLLISKACLLLKINNKTYLNIVCLYLYVLPF